MTFETGELESDQLKRLPAAPGAVGSREDDIGFDFGGGHLNRLG